jgi:Uma2 family endonuclease
MRRSEEKLMRNASAPSLVESTPIVTEIGSNGSPSSLPIIVDDDILYEVVDGKIVEKEMGAREVEIAGILVQYLGTFARTHRLGRALIEFIFRIDPTKDLQRRPDVAFVSHASWPVHRRVPDVAVWDMVPDLAIEVVSPSNTANHVHEKIHEYFKAGVSRVWVVYPRQKEVYVYASPTEIQVLQLGVELDGGDLVPGFRLPLAALFEDDAE